MIFTLVYDPEQIMSPGHYHLSVNDLREELANGAWPDGTLWTKEGETFKVVGSKLYNTKTQQEYVI